MTSSDKSYPFVCFAKIFSFCCMQNVYHLSIGKMLPIISVGCDTALAECFSYSIRKMSHGVFGKVPSHFSVGKVLPVCLQNVIRCVFGKVFLSCLLDGIMVFLAKCFPFLHCIVPIPICL